MPCPILLSLHCTVTVFLNEINGDRDGDYYAFIHPRSPNK